MQQPLILVVQLSGELMRIDPVGQKAGKFSERTFTLVSSPSLGPGGPGSDCSPVFKM